MIRFMLDTNAVRHFLDANPRLVEKVQHYQPTSFGLSVVTEAEMLFGVARNPNAKKLAERVAAALGTFEIEPWTSPVAATYGRFRADLEMRGRTLASLDMMIAAHAKHLGAVLVTSDRALLSTPGLTSEDWLAP